MLYERREADLHYRCYNKTALLRNRASFDPSRRNRKGVGAGLIIGIRVVGLSSNADGNTNG